MNNAQPGDYIYYAQADFKNSNIISDQGRFSVEETKVEKLNTVMNINLLKLLASSTKGKYYDIKDYDELMKKIETLNSSSVKEKIYTSEIDIWSNEWIMLIIICLFATEWFIRKRSGML